MPFFSVYTQCHLNVWGQYDFLICFVLFLEEMNIFIQQSDQINAALVRLLSNILPTPSFYSLGNITMQQKQLNDTFDNSHITSWILINLAVFKFSTGHFEKRES